MTDDFIAPGSKPASIAESIYQSIAQVRLIDPHSHINPLSPASTTLADLLGYHYYTELAHSAGMPKSQIEQEGLPPRELVGRLVENLDPINNTAQYRWLVQICKKFFDFEGDRLDRSNWESVYETAEAKMASAQWADTVLDQSGVDAVFLTNDFDDDLQGFDSDVYIPCLRTDDLVFHLAKTSVRDRLAAATDLELHNVNSIRDCLVRRFDHFLRSGARACAISLPPGFSPTPVSDARASRALDGLLTRGGEADPADLDAVSRRVFWTLAELCDEYGLPFDLMIGVNRGVYADGVHQGQDLYDSRVSLTQYKSLFNTFPDVKFPVSVLASVTNQELVSHAWIFPNVITNGHWWYSNTPSIIARDAMARLEAVPRNKQIGYYSDAYKLEFIWPKFDMYKQVLSKLLASHFVTDCGWSEQAAIDLGTQILRGNVDEIFPRVAVNELPELRDPADDERPFHSLDQPTAVESTLDFASGAAAIAGAAGSAIVAGAIGGSNNDDDLGTAAPSDPSLDPLEDLDPTPDETEVTDVGAADVELLNFENRRDDRSVNLDDRDVLALDDSDDLVILSDDMNDEPLDVGNLLDDDQSPASGGGESPRSDGGTDSTHHPNIHSLRGDDVSFLPDGDQLKLKPDSTTGEWTFPTDDES